MQKLSITKRPGQIGGSIVNRTENHGKKEKVPAVSIPVSGILLLEAEINAILGDPGSYGALFTAERSVHLEPRWLGIQAIEVSDKFKEAKVTLQCANSTEKVVLKPATVGSIRLEPQVGGQVAMSCTISGVPDEHLATLLMLNQKCTIAILNGSLVSKDDNQGDLPLEGGGPVVGNGHDSDDADGPTRADADREEAEATESAIGRQIRSSEAKGRRAARKGK